jgi:hypothetical protein
MQFSLCARGLKTVRELKLPRKAGTITAVSAAARRKNIARGASLIGLENCQPRWEKELQIDKNRDNKTGILTGSGF